MTKKEAILQTIMLVQQLEPSYWDLWENKDSIITANNGDLRPLLDDIISKLKSNDIIPSEVYSILHDKDLYEDNSTKPKHIHILFKFEKGATLKNIALAIDINPQYLEKLKSGRYGYDNSLAYLIHAKDGNKYQYKPEEVVTILGEDYKSLYSRRIDTWLKGKATKIAKETSYSIDWLISEILVGNITKNNILLTDEYYRIYGQYKRRINEALDTANEKKSLKTILALENKEFKKTIIFIEGKSGIGKTVFAKNLIKIIKKLSIFYSGKIWESCITASTNAFDEYSSQEILLLDDIRGNSFSVSDWLKLLDPYSISPISARYHNKQAVSKVIIITSPHSPKNFFTKVKYSSYENFDQFYRRLDFYIKLEEKFLVQSIYKKNKHQKKVILKKNYQSKVLMLKKKSTKKVITVKNKLLLTKNHEKKKIVLKKEITNKNKTSKEDNKVKKKSYFVKKLSNKTLKEYEYKFSAPKIRNDTQIKKLIANKVIRNMNWNKKELSTPTDQSE